MSSPAPRTVLQPVLAITSNPVANNAITKRFSISFSLVSDSRSLFDWPKHCPMTRLRPWGLFLRASSMAAAFRLEPRKRVCNRCGMTLAELLPEEDYRFQMRFKKGTVREFFGPSSRNFEILGERRIWLTENPRRHAAMLPEGAEILRETINMARKEQTLPDGDSTLSSTELQPFDLCVSLGLAWEPDFLLLRTDANREVRLLGGCVCFPSSWDLNEKVGHPIQFIHSVVPGLNPALGTQIQGYLTRLRPGTIWLRANWGLSRSPELNQHPARGLPRLKHDVALEEVYLRIEHQALTALPVTGGVLFGIRIAVHNLVEIQREPVLRRGLARALTSLPEEMARYKNIADCRGRLISLLEA
jgi:hypothetical protein